MENLENSGFDDQQEMRAGMSSDAVWLRDWKGQKFYPGTTCVRHNWGSPFLNGEHLIDSCLSWKVSLDDRGMRLLSRPVGLDIALTTETASMLEIYEEASSFAPEKFPDRWKQLLDLGWEVWAESNLPASIWLRGRYKKARLQTQSIIEAVALLDVGFKHEAYYDELIREVTRYRSPGGLESTSFTNDNSI